MKSFKDYVSLQETTVPEDLLHIPEKWEHHSKVSDDTKKKMEAALGTKGHTLFPLGAVGEVEPDVDVEEHLQDHGYKIHDYKRGIATTKKRIGNDAVGYRDKLVEERIGAVLNKTNAPDHVKSAYMADPARQAASKTGAHVCITTTRLGVAGMTVGTSWKDESCMNLRDGAFKHKLSDDSENGTHVAYLVSHDDKGAANGAPDHPLARISLKPYHETTEEWHDRHEPETDTIYRAERKIYGANSSHFEHAVNRWAEKNYPAKDGVPYRKNAKVYDDTSNTILKTMDDNGIHNAIKSDTRLPDFTTIPSDQMHRALDFAKSEFSDRSEALGTFISNTAYGNSSLSQSHVKKLYDMSKTLPEYDRQNVQRHIATNHGDKLSTNTLRDYLTSNVGNHIPSTVLQSKKLSSDLIDGLPVSHYADIPPDKLLPRHIDKLVSSIISPPAEWSSLTHTISPLRHKLSKSNVHDLVHKGSLGSANTRIMIVHEHFDEGMHDHIMRNSPISINTLMHHSKFVKASDVTTSDIVPVSENDHVGDVEGPKIKDFIVNHANNRMFTMSNAISKHMTDSDYSKLASSDNVVEFKNPAHSNKMLDALKNNLLSAHDAVGNSEHPSDASISKFRAAHAAYTGSMDDHMVGHIRLNGENGPRFNVDEHNKMLDRISEVEALPHTHHIPNYERITERLHRVLKRIAQD